MRVTGACKFGFHVKQKAPGKRRYVEHRGTLCSRCLANPPAKGQGYCKSCRAVHEKARRARLKDLGENTKLSKGNEHGQFERSPPVSPGGKED